VRGLQAEGRKQLRKENSQLNVILIMSARPYEIPVRELKEQAEVVCGALENT